MTEHKTQIYSSNWMVAAAFASYLCDEIAKVKVFHIALSGGSTPKLLFQILAEVYKDKIDWTTVHLYWGDERCVAPDDEQSNYLTTSTLLIQQVPIPATNIHRVYGESPQKKEAIRYGKELQDNLPQQSGIPVFDMVLLGMGTDGHTASIFPHEIALLESDEICAVATHPDSGQKRITITGRVINAAKQVHFLITGSAKSPVLDEIFNEKGQYKKYPASYITQAEWWMDKEAGRFL